MRRFAAWVPLATVVVIAVGSSSGSAPTAAVAHQNIDVLLTQYLTGDADAAVRTLASWPDAQVSAQDMSEQVVREWDLTSVDDAWRGAALVMLHTEAGILNQRFGGSRDGIGAGLAPREAHVAAALRLISALEARSESSPAVRAFCEEWMVFASSLVVRMYGYLGTGFPDAPGRWFRGTPASELLRGSLAERAIGPLTTRGHFSNWSGDEAWYQPVSTVHGLLSNRSRAEAETHLRRALDRDPSLAEARLRLGRIQYLFGDTRAAQPLLERALADARAQGDRFVSVIAALVLGQLHEYRRQDALAERAYRLAVELEPGAHPPAVALSRLLLAQGRTAESRQVIDQLWNAGGPTRLLWNPWALYQAAQVHDSDARLERLRQTIATQTNRTRRAGLPLSFLPQRSAITKPDSTPTSASPLAPSPATKAPQSVYRAGVDGVRVDITVLNGSEPVAGLSADDFVVIDKGRPQTIQSVATVSSLSVMLVHAIGQPSAAFLEQEVLPVTRTVINATVPGDRISIIGVAESLSLELRESTAQEATRVVTSLRPRRLEHAALRDGIYAAASLAGRGAGRPVVIAISDEDQTWNVSGGGRETGSWLRQTETLETLRDVGTPVDGVWVRQTGRYAIPTGVPGRIDGVFGLWAGEQLVNELGKVFRAAEPDLAGRLTTRLHQLRSGYVLTYTPSGVSRGDGWHKIEVRLKDPRRGTVVQSRTGYISR